MKAKLTLSIEASVIEMAKEIAKETGTSLSQIIENHLRILSGRKEAKPKDTAISSKVRALRGCIKLEDERDYKEIVAEEIMKKYNRLE